MTPDVTVCTRIAPEEGADHRAAAAEDRRAADDDGGDDGELASGADTLVERRRAGRDEEAGADSDERAGDGVDARSTRGCTFIPASRAALALPPMANRWRPPAVCRRYHQPRSTTTIVIAKLCGTPRVRPASPRPKTSSVAGMLFTVDEPNTRSAKNWKMFAVPKVMMIA